MLPSLRPLIAEIMRRTANAYETDHERWQIVLNGAATLDWCEANDPDSDPCGQTARVDELESAFEDVKAALIAWNTSISNKRHAELKDEITEILLSLGL